VSAVTLGTSLAVYDTADTAVALDSRDSTDTATYKMTGGALA